MSFIGNLFGSKEKEAQNQMQKVVENARPKEVRIEEVIAFLRKREDEIQKLKEENDALKTRLTTNQTNDEKHHRVPTADVENPRQLENRNTELKAENEKLRNTNKYLQDRLKEIELALDRVTEEKSKLRTENSELKDKLSAKSNNRPQPSHNYTSNSSWRPFASKISLTTVQAAICKGPGDFQGVDDQMIQRLNESCLQDHVKVDIKDLQYASCDVIMFFCLKISRIGTDVSSAWKKVAQQIKGSAPVLLIVLHHTAPHMRVSRTRDMLSPTDANHFRVILDVSFERGYLHSSPGNTESLLELTRTVTQIASAQS